MQPILLITTVALCLWPTMINPPPEVKAQWPPAVTPKDTRMIVHSVTGEIRVVRKDKTYLIKPFLGPLEGGTDDRVRLGLGADDQIVLGDEDQALVSRITDEGELAPAETLGLGQSPYRVEGPVMLPPGTQRIVRWLTVPEPKGKSIPNINQPTLVLPISNDEVDPMAIPFRYWAGRPGGSPVAVRLEYRPTVGAIVVKDWGTISEPSRILQIDLEDAKRKIEAANRTVSGTTLELHLVVTGPNQEEERALRFRLSDPDDSSDPAETNERFERLEKLLMGNRKLDPTQEVDRNTELGFLVERLCGNQRSRVLMLLIEHLRRPSGKGDRAVRSQLSALCLDWDINFESLLPESSLPGR